MSQQQYTIMIETPKGSTVKYVWDEELKAIRVKRALPVGAHFPFSFGFFPNTLAEDGDPLDVMVLTDGTAQPATMMRVRIIGALLAEQTCDETIRNDRIIAVLDSCPVYGAYQFVSDMPEKLQRGLIQFFKSYNEYREQKFECIGWAGPEEAKKLIEDAKK